MDLSELMKNSVSLFATGIASVSEIAQLNKLLSFKRHFPLQKEECTLRVHSFSQITPRESLS